MTTTKAFRGRESGKSRTIFTVFSVFSLFSPESETTSPALIVSFLLCFFACLIVSISFRLFGCFFFFNSKNNWKHNPQILLCYFTSLVLSARFWPYFFLNENIHAICCWKLGEFKRGVSLINEGILPKAGEKNLAGGRGTPLNIKSNLKDNSGLIRVFEIYRINYCFLVLSKTGIFFLQPWRSRRSNIVWRGHMLLSFSNGKRQSSHTFGRNNTVKPHFKDNFFRKICMKRVFGFQQKGTLLFLFTCMTKVNSVENKQLYKTRISNKTVQITTLYKY